MERNIEILVLGTIHLGDSSDYYRRESARIENRLLEPLIDRLSTFSPDAIFVEFPSEDEIALGVKEYGNFAPYVEVAAKLQKELGVGYAQAGKIADEKLSAGEFARAIPYLVAAYRIPSALLNWFRLDDRESLPPYLSRYLSTFAASSGEIGRIAVPLALRLNHMNLHSMDAIVEDVPPDMTDELMEAFRTLNEKAPFLKSLFDEINRLFEEYSKRGNLLEFYRRINNYDILRDLERQWDALRRFGGNVGRIKFLTWQVRNSRMVSAIVDRSARMQFSRVLIIVGLSHKLIMERFISAFDGLRIVSVEDVLG